MANPSPKIPHFFQPLLHNFAANLAIPVAFYEKYLEGRPGCGTRAELRSRLRRQGWKVGMVGRRIVDGWAEFADAHELKVGYFLVIKYDGGTVFHVSVFDTSACEVEYGDEHDEDDAVEGDGEELKMDSGQTSYVGTLRPSYLISLHFPACFCVANKLNVSCSEIIVKDEAGKVWPVKVKCKKGGNAVYTMGGWRSFVEGNGLQKGDRFNFRIVSKGKIPVLSFHRIGMRDQTEVATRAKRRKAAEVPELVTSAGEVEHPSLDEDEHDNVEQDDEEDTVEEDDDEDLSEEDYEEEDMVKEDYDKEEDMVDGDDEEHKTELDHSRKRMKNRNPATDDSTASYVGTMCRAYLTSLYFPVYFSRANNLDSCSEIDVEDDRGKLWPVKIRLKRNTNLVYTVGGWTSFIRGNGIRKGDRYEFRVISYGTKPVLSFRRIGPKHKAALEEEEKVPELALRHFEKTTGSLIPGKYLIRTITQASLDRSRLFLGINFAKMNGLADRDRSGDMILRNSQGKSWVATLKREGNSSRFFITSGWTEFALANGLEAGRVFRLEVVEPESKLLTLKLTRRVTLEDL
uniref:TF-B3 domain-containing protein n=1 Tax=Kalanchoe fedtschenkoi TaxID=63787 RepID=A0A7N0RGJ3_KALFE